MNERLELFKRAKSLFASKYNKIDSKLFYEEMFGNYVEQNKNDNGKTNIVVTSSKKNSYTITRSEFLENDFTSYMDRYDSVFISCCSYYGKSPSIDRLGMLHSFVVDIDGMSEIENYKNLIEQIKSRAIPVPTYVVPSGHGCHLYYFLENPIKYTLENRKSLYQITYSISKALAKIAYNKHVSTKMRSVGFDDNGREIRVMDPDLIPPTQGLRAVGSKNKFGIKNEAFKIGEKYSNVVALIDTISRSLFFSNRKAGTDDYFKAVEAFKAYYNNQNLNEFLSKKVYEEPSINNQEVMFFIKDFEAKIVNEVVPGHRFNSLTYLIIDYIKVKYTNEKIRKRIKAIIKILNEKANKNGQPLLTKNDEVALFSMLDNRFLYEGKPLRKDIIESKTGLSFDAAKNKREAVNKEMEIVPVVSSTKKYSILETSAKEVLLVWKKRGCNGTRGFKSIYEELGINHKVYDKTIKEVREFTKNVLQIAKETESSKEAIFDAELNKGIEAIKEKKKEIKAYQEGRRVIKKIKQEEYSAKKKEMIEKVQGLILSAMEEAKEICEKSFDEYKILSKTMPEAVVINHHGAMPYKDVYLLKKNLKLVYKNNELYNVSTITWEERDRIRSKRRAKKSAFFKVSNTPEPMLC